MSDEKKKKSPVQKALEAETKPRGTVTQLNRLIHRIGGKSYNPLEDTWHKWLKANRNKPGKLWMFFWIYERAMVYDCAKYTNDYATRSPFASDPDGKVLTLAHMAADRGTDIRNIRRDWDEGVADKMWRHGKLDKGEHEKGIYLCGEVAVTGEDSPDDGTQERVCTNPANYPWEKLPPYVSKHLQTLPATEQHNFWGRYWPYREVRQTVEGDALLAARQVMDTYEDNLYSDFGASKNRQIHKVSSKSKAQTEEELKARGERLTKLQQAIDGFVQTLFEHVQSPKSESAQSDVQTFSDDATLLPSDLSEEADQRAGAVSESARTEPTQPKHSNRSQKSKYLPEEAPPQAKPRKRNESPYPGQQESLAAFKDNPVPVQIFVEQFKLIQQLYPTSNLAQFPINEFHPPDQILIGRLVLITGAHGGPENESRVVAFMNYLAKRFTAVTHGALGKMPARDPNSPNGPRSWAMILEFALDFADEHQLSWGRRARAAGKG